MKNPFYLLISMNSKKDLAYIAGLQIGQQMSGEMFERVCEQLPIGDVLDKELFLAGFMASMKDFTITTRVSS